MMSSFHWIVLALLAAFLESLKDLSSKSSMRTLSPQLTGLAASAVPIPILLTFLIMTPSWPTVDPQFFLALAVSGSLNVLAMFQFMRALQESDLSLAIPFIAFTPIFLLVTSPYCWETFQRDKTWVAFSASWEAPTSSTFILCAKVSSPHSWLSGSSPVLDGCCPWLLFSASPQISIN